MKKILTITVMFLLIFTISCNNTNNTKKVSDDNITNKPIEETETSSENNSIKEFIKYFDINNEYYIGVNNQILKYNNEQDEFTLFEKYQFNNLMKITPI